jgi:hypothetical protein
MPNCCEIESLSIYPSGSVFLDCPLERVKHLGFKLTEIVAASCFPGRNDNRVAPANLEYPSADSDMMLNPGPVPPGHHRNCQRR